MKVDENIVYEQATQKSVSLYPQHIAYVERVVRERGFPGRQGFSRALQVILDEHRDGSVGPVVAAGMETRPTVA